MLAAKCYPASGDNQQRPWLVFIHGLLGSGEDWASVLPYFSQWSCITLDLPGHGGSQSLNSQDAFAALSQQIGETLLAYNIHHYVLIGYSLGGRSAMYHACFGDSAGLKGLAIEGGNPGLRRFDEREARLEHDRQWADKFRRLPLPDALSEWYRQPVFAELSEPARSRLIMRRSHNSGSAVAHMLEATSLGHQPWLVEELQRLVECRNIPFCYLCGEQDVKFQQIARDNGFPLRMVNAAGHNAHSVNPAGFAERLLSFLKEC
ncbi:2-succinyl-6-hydroxy-2,4-cyclohexadiene-1-carboxylate synthase [Budvicia diplopodorum]|uniref:2-succinyl-6-hydroxy-2, 4-cyclohexadiene-1-carboxylate synthase n=1 Tax=Budvicia diplopodorum TaxID=1119056 RepID=UPI00135AE289|nr:2-succinyl-6-hydroxy-2,4-cyclohexadiene-1-carboxylate synthase [Budvicia diplopodorum]